MSENENLTNQQQPGAFAGSEVPPREPEPEGSRWAKAHHVLLYFLLAAIVIWLLSGIYMVKADEIAIIERLGDFVRAPSAAGQEKGPATLVEPGMHYALPWPVDIVHKIPIQQSQTLVVADFNAPVSANDEYKKALTRQGVEKAVVDAILDPYLITADKNVLHAQITVQYRISDPEAFLTRVYDDPATIYDERNDMLRQLAAHALIRDMALELVDDALTSGREQLRNKLLARLQKNVRDMDFGIEVEKLDINDVQPPAAILDKFRDATKARQDAERDIQQAETDRDTAKTSADGMALTTVGAAEAEERKIVSMAQGEADRFSKVYAQYKISPAVTWANIYFDGVGAIVENADRIWQVQPHQIIDLVLEPPDVRLPGEGLPQNSAGAMGGPGGGGTGQ